MKQKLKKTQGELTNTYQQVEYIQGQINKVRNSVGLSNNN